MKRRTLLRQLAEGLALAVGHNACRPMSALPAEPAPKVFMPLSPSAPSAALPTSADPSPVALACDLSAAPRSLRHPWRHCVGSCHAPTALRADWQRQLTRAHGELGFRHVRFHGLLSDDMGTLVCQDDRFLFSFFNIDRVFDFLLSIGMKPIVELSFMPGALSSDGNSVFRYRANVTPPKKMADWALLMTTLVGHWVERYGVDEVAQWPLEVWNEPNLVAFWTGGQAKYFELYRATWNAIKAISPKLQVGGPATAANAWLDDFNRFCDANACKADFISTHYYPTDAFGSVHTDTVSQLSDAPMSVMRDRALDARAAAGARPLYYTEWNITSNPRDPMHDGPFCAALAAKFLLSVDDVVDAFSWWVFSDIFEENYFPSMPFHGGFGLLNLYGVAKPVYRGFELVAQLGTRQWPVAGSHRTVSAWVGAPEDETVSSVLLVNVAMPRHDIATELVAFQLAGTNGRRPRAAMLSRIDDEHANAQAAWERMGRPEYPHPHQVDALHAASTVEPEALPIVGDGERATFTLALPPNAMALVRIEWETPT
jgi:xylan 1,4-beta-xylosidase